MVISQSMYEQLDMVTDMMNKDLEKEWFSLLTVHYVSAPFKEVDWFVLPWQSLILPKFSAATHYDLVMFREKFNVFINKLIEDTLPTIDINEES